MPTVFANGLSGLQSGKVCSVNTLRPCCGPTAMRVFGAWDGFWVKTLGGSLSTGDLTLLIPNTRSPGVITTKPGQAISLESAAVTTNTNDKIKISPSLTKRDEHRKNHRDKNASGEEWGKKSNDYTSDFHPLSAKKVLDQWDFEVRSNDPAGEVTLSWTIPDNMPGKSWLIDQDSGEVIEPDSGGSYTFVMDGQQRHFTWEYEKRPGKGGGKPKAVISTL